MKESINTFSRSGFRKDPYAYYAALRNQSPVHFFDTGFWALSKYKHVAGALRRPDLFLAHTGVMQSTPIGEDPPVHTKLRKITSKILSGLKTSSLEKQLRETTEQILERAQHQGRFELMSTLATELPYSVVWQTLGIPLESRPSCFEWMRQLKPYLLVEELLVSLPIWTDEGEGLSREERLRLIHFIFLAATETTRALIGNATLALLRNPDQMELVRHNKQLLPSLVEESLRYEAPFPFRERRTNREVEIDGVTIPAGAFVFLLLGSANRDPEEFPDPDRFLVTRDASRHLAFGDGPHFCLGALQAKMQAQIAMEGLLFQLEGFEPEDELDRLEYIDTYKLRSLKALHLTTRKKN